MPRPRRYPSSPLPPMLRAARPLRAGPAPVWRIEKALQTREADARTRTGGPFITSVCRARDVRPVAGMDRHKAPAQRRLVGDRIARCPFPPHQAGVLVPCLPPKSSRRRRSSRFKYLGAANHLDEPENGDHASLGTAAAAWARTGEPALMSRLRAIRGERQLLTLRSPTVPLNRQVLVQIEQHEQLADPRGARRDREIPPVVSVSALNAMLIPSRFTRSHDEVAGTWGAAGFSGRFAADLSRTTPGRSRTPRSDPVSDVL